jgi:RNA polymerase sigma factor (sigma-70 family)
MPQEPHTCRVEELLVHTEGVRRLALSLVRCESAADDLVQQTFLAALEHPPKEQGATRGWLARVMRNIAVDRSRRRLRRQLREERATSQPGGQGPSDQDLLPVEIQARLELQELMAQAVKELPDPYRTMVVLYYFDDLNSAQIAKKLKLNPSTVRNQLSRAREKVRQRLESQYGDHWSTMCFSLLLRPFSASTSLLPVGWSSALKPIAGALAITAGLWMWQTWTATPDHSGEPILADAVTSAGPEQAGVIGASAADGQRRTIDHAQQPQQFGIEIVDQNQRAIAGVQCRVYAMRKPMRTGELLGPEALHLASFPVLADGVSSANGSLKFALPTPTTEGPEPQLCIVAEKIGYTKRAMLFHPSSLDGERSSVRMELHPGVQRSFLVVDESSQPIADARLMPSSIDLDLRDPNFQAFFAVTDEEGSAVFNSLHPQASRVKCWAPGFLTTRLDLEPPNPTEPPRTILLQRGVEADLHVYSANQPYPGARVFLRQGYNFNSTLHGSPLEEGYLGETDAHGYLRVAGIDPRLRSDLVIKIGGVEERILAVEQDGRYRADFPQIRQLKGRILQASGTPASHALVMVVDPLALSARHLSSAWSKVDGTFELSIKAGSFAFAIVHPGGTLLQPGLQEVDHDVDFGDLFLPATPPLTVILQDPDGNPIQSRGQVKLLLHPEMAAAQMGRPQLLPLFWPIGLQTVLPYQGSDHQFQFRHLPAGEYWLQARAPGYCESRVRIEAQAHASEILVTLEPSFTNDLRVVDAAGQPLPQRQVELYPAEYDWKWKSRSQPQHPRQRPVTGYSNEQGRVQFEGLSPGTWRLALPGFAAYGQYLAEFQIKASGTLGEVELPAHGSLTVATHAPDQVLAGSVVQFFTGRGAGGVGRPWRKIARTNGQGSTEQIELVADRYQVLALVPYTVPRSAEVQVVSGLPTYHQVDLTGTSLTGQLPVGTLNGQILLVERVPEHAGQAEEIHKKMRKVVRHPPSPRLGGIMRGGTADTPWQARYAATQPTADGSFRLQHLPDGDYWLMASADGCRTAGPFDLSIADGKWSAPSLKDDLQLALAPGAGFRIYAPELLHRLLQDPDAHLQAVIQSGSPLDEAPGSAEKSARAPWQVELKPADGPVLEINKDRPRTYQITFTWTRGNGQSSSWSQQLQTQTGLIQDLRLELPE